MPELSPTKISSGYQKCPKVLLLPKDICLFSSTEEERCLNLFWTAEFLLIEQVELLRGFRLKFIGCVEHIQITKEPVSHSKVSLRVHLFRGISDLKFGLLDIFDTFTRACLKIPTITVWNRFELKFQNFVPQYMPFSNQTNQRECWNLEFHRIKTSNSSKQTHPRVLTPKSTQSHSSETNFNWSKAAYIFNRCAAL